MVAYEFQTSTTSTFEHTLLDINIFPNPTADKFQIESDLEIFNIELWSSHGKLLRTWDNSNDLQIINTSDLPSGTYWVKVLDKASRNVSMERQVKL